MAPRGLAACGGGGAAPPASSSPLQVGCWGFDGWVHWGDLAVNASAAAALSRAFGLLSAARFPVRQVHLVDDFGGDDERSMLAHGGAARRALDEIGWPWGGRGKGRGM